MKQRPLYILLVIISLIGIQCTETDYPQGKRYYDAYCGNCHMDNGEGLSKLIPSLSHSDYIAQNQEQLPCLIIYGIAKEESESREDFELSMPGNDKLTDIEILNIINYINTAWDNTTKPTSIKEVKELRTACIR